MTARELARWCRATAREWGWRHTAAGAALGLSCVFLFYQAPFLYYTLVAPEPRPYLAWFLWNTAQFGWPAVFALRVADRAVAAGTGAVRAYGTALAAVLLAGSSVLAVPVGLLLDALARPALLVEPAALAQALRTYGALNMGLVFPLCGSAALGTTAYALWRRELLAREQLHAEMLAQARRARTAQARRLLALQARVEPQVLFDALRRVRAEMAHPGDAAEALLGGVILLLRAMQPGIAARASTVAREFELVEAYARVADLDGLRPPRLRLSLGPGAGQAELAPLALLPALKALAAAPGTRWDVRATRRADRLVLETRGDPAGAAEAAALRAWAPGDVKARIQAVHGPDARWLVDPQAGRWQLDLPFVPGAADDAPPQP